MSVSISKVTVQTDTGASKSLGDLKGKVLLIVNVASKCGFTKQYSGLQNLENTYASQGFQILAFPCNDFGGQEPASLPEIKSFCSNTYNVSFPIFEKVHAKGKTTEPFTTLNKTEPAGDVEWNFEKFLIGKDGTVLKRFKSSVEPNSVEIKEAIEKALSA
tara:strand:+ start:1700 stop:2179 length:480 start_codon:yes stop_codon:yes gene_type:complete